MREHPNRINDKTTFDDFKQIFGAEAAFRNLVSKEKEKIFDELVGPLRKVSKESKQKIYFFVLIEFRGSC